MKGKELILASVFVASFGAAGQADVNRDLTNEASQMNSLSSTQDASKVTDRISREFADFLGADSNAVVIGLRNGTPIRLARTVSTPSSTTGTAPANTTSPTTTTTTTTTIINPPTGKMGFGNVFISLALAKQELAQLGITQPTPEQLKAALVGGSITTGPGTTTTAIAPAAGAATTTNTTKLDGILTMRSQHLGWGQIAHKLGFKLGPVIGSIKTANHNISTAVSPSTKNQGTVTAANQTNTGSKGVIVSGSGKVHGPVAHENSGIASSGQGIVTASGRSVANANAYAYGKGIVTGSGHVTGASNGGATSGDAGNSSGHGNGHNKN
jgi:hypothetical protein